MYMQGHTIYQLQSVLYAKERQTNTFLQIQTNTITNTNNLIQPKQSHLFLFVFSSLSAWRPSISWESSTVGGLLTFVCMVWVLLSLVVFWTCVYLIQQGKKGIIIEFFFLLVSYRISCSFFIICVQFSINLVIS